VKTYDIARWVDKEDDPRPRKFREAVHIILAAIATSQNLNSKMILKGGQLLAIRYASSRFTRDIDFSTSSKVSGFNLETFLREFEQSLVVACENLPYDLDCRVQSYEFKPPNPEATFPTLVVRVGYANKSDVKSHRRLVAKNSSDVVKIDYSFNEKIQKTDPIRLSDGGKVLVYSFSDLVAEKYRAILQQEVRNRSRRQDVYDLHYLIGRVQEIGQGEKQQILNSLRIKSQSRNLEVNKDSISNKAIIARSRRDYPGVGQEIEGELPDFDEAYGEIRKFYESLPW